LIETLGLKDHVIFINDFLEHDESMLLLQAADVLVYPYQRSGESASGAIRYGLSSLRPVLVTPLAIFADVEDVVQTLRGTSPIDIAEGIEELLADPGAQEALSRRQARWLGEHSFASVAERLMNTIIGLYEDRHRVRVVGQIGLRKRIDRSSTAFQRASSRLDPEIFLRVVYQRFFDRMPDSEGLSYFGSLLRNGVQSKAEIIESLEVSDEARRVRRRRDGQQASLPGAVRVPYEELDAGDDKTFITRVYTKLLLRAPDHAGLEGWISRLRSGSVNRRNVVETILSSEEFLERRQLVWVD
jgi:hypothetical protein